MTAPRQGALAVPRIRQPVETPTGETLPAVDAVLQILRAGGSQRAAAAWAGIHPATLSGWISKGLATWEQTDRNPEKQADTIENPEDPLANVAPDDRPYVDLAIAVEQAAAVAEMRLVSSVYEAAKGDWRAAQAALAARARGTWAATRVEGGADSNDVPVARGVAFLDDGGAARLVATLEERRAAALPVGEVARG